MDIQVGMPLINSLGDHLGRVVDPGEQYIEIETATGEHYWVPTSLIANIDEQQQICLSGSGDDIANRWLNKDPEAFKEAMVDEASEESFPGSDPPSFNPQKS